jgi:hypothetical protein
MVVGFLSSQNLGNGTEAGAASDCAATSAALSDAGSRR